MSSTNLPLQDRVAIITGASRGIGKSIALHLASLGAKIVINYTSPSSEPLANEVVTQINSHSPNHAIAVKSDVSDPAQVQTLFDKAEQIFETQPHILVTSAGVLDPKYPSLINTTISDFDRVFSVNTKGTFLCMQEGGRRIMHGGGGRIVTVSSSLVGASRPGYGAYTASKAAVEALTKIMAKELKGSGITVNSVAPGPTETEMFYDGKSEEDVKKTIEQNPLGRLGKAEDIANLVGFLVCDGGELVNGQVIRINGGYV